LNLWYENVCLSFSVCKRRRRSCNKVSKKAVLRGTSTENSIKLQLCKSDGILLCSNLSDALVQIQRSTSVRVLTSRYFRLRKAER